MAGRVTAVDKLFDFGREDELDVELDAKAPRSVKPAPRKAPPTRKGPLKIPTLAEAYTTIKGTRPAVRPLSKTAYFTPEEWERIARAVHHLGGIPAGGLVRFGALYLLERLEEANGGPFPAIPGR